MNEPIAEREALWTQFLERWPLESLRQMSLEEYNQAGSDDHFCRWLEKHTESLAQSGADRLSSSACFPGWTSRKRAILTAYSPASTPG